MTAPPRVTVLMPVHNGERFLAEAINSVLEQDFADVELLAVDDGSTDATPEILAAWARRDPRVVIHRLASRGGISAALNAGLAVARCELVARHDADDLVLPGRFAAQVRALDQAPDAVMATCRYRVMDEQGRDLHTAGLTEHPDVVAHLLCFRNAVGGHGQVMLRRSAVQAAGGYDTSIMVSQDYDLWTRLAPLGKIVQLRHVGGRHRLHPRRITLTAHATQCEEALLVSTRTLTRLLGREPAREEVLSACALWRDDAGPADPDTADRLHAEALGASGLDRAARLRRRVRLLTARRWFSLAARAAAAGEPATAADRLRRAMRWHPAGPVAGAADVTLSAARRLRQAARRPTAWR